MWVNYAFQKQLHFLSVLKFVRGDVVVVAFNIFGRVLKNLRQCSKLTNPFILNADSVKGATLAAGAHAPQRLAMHAVHVRCTGTDEAPFALPIVPRPPRQPSGPAWHGVRNA